MIFSQASANRQTANNLLHPVGGLPAAPIGICHRLRLQLNPELDPIGQVE
jgi:hypothetical protein